MNFKRFACAFCLPVVSVIVIGCSSSQPVASDDATRTAADQIVNTSEQEKKSTAQSPSGTPSPKQTPVKANTHETESLPPALTPESPLQLGRYFVKSDSVKVKTRDGAIVTLTKGDHLMIVPEKEKPFVAEDLHWRRRLSIESKHLIRVPLASNQSDYAHSFAQVIDYFSAAVKQNPTPLNYLARGKVYADFAFEEENNTKSIADFSEAIRLDPSLAEAYFCRARTRRTDNLKRLADFNEAIRLDPQFARAYLERSRLWDYEAEHDKIRADLDEAIRIDPTWAEPRIARATELWSMWEEVSSTEPEVQLDLLNPYIVEMEAIRRLDPEYWRRVALESYYHRAELLEQLHQYKLAVADYTLLIQQVSKWADLQQTEKALLARAYRDRAWLQVTCPDAEVRDGENAVADIQQALLLNDKDPYHEELAAAFAELGDFDQAVKLQQEVLKRSPGGSAKHDRRLEYYRSKRPYREQDGEDLVQHEGVPTDLQEKTPQQVMELFYEHIAAGEFNQVTRLFDPTSHTLTGAEEEFQKSDLDKVSNLLQRKVLKVDVVATKQDDRRALAVVCSRYALGNDNNKTTYRAVRLEQRAAGWMISKGYHRRYESTLGDPSPIDYDDPLVRWFYQQRSELGGIPEPEPLRKAPEIIVAGADPEGWGSVRGRFVFDGTPPQPKMLIINKDVAAFGTDKMPSESLLVGPDNGLANVAVYLLGDPTRVHELYGESAHATVTLESANAKFQPHLLALRPGQTLELKNSLSVPASFRAENRWFNVTILPTSRSTEAVREADAPLVTVTSAIHLWMWAYLIVLDHPYVAISKSDGTFEINHLPAGEWAFQVWHEQSQQLRLKGWSRGRFKLRIPAGQTVDMGVIKIPPKAFLPAAPDVPDNAAQKRMSRS